MRPVAVHSPTMQASPDACYWVDDEGQLQAYEPVTTPSTILAAVRIHRKIPGTKWRDYFEYLAEQTPRPDNWEVEYIADDANPRSVLKMLRRG